MFCALLLLESRPRWIVDREVDEARPMRIVVTGGDGFLGTNLRVRLHELGYTDVISANRQTTQAAMQAALAEAQFVFHVAGVNRPEDPSEFETGNVQSTRSLCDMLRGVGRTVPIAFTSSTQAPLDNPYGRSKLAAEQIVEDYGHATGSPFYILRLTNVFGKWARPHYNSAVATFCHNLAHGLPVTVHDPAAPMQLLYIDDAINGLIALLQTDNIASGRLEEIGPLYATTVGEIVALLRSISESRRTLTVPDVGRGLARALYATYLSYLPPSHFSYNLRPHRDARGTFTEMLRTQASGQVSYFTAPPGVTRGEHYHHSKTEKFLVLRGTARFGFRHIVTNEVHKLRVVGGQGCIVESVPGWTHSITNVGDDELLVMLWANEVFDPEKADTIPSEVGD